MNTTPSRRIFLALSAALLVLAAYHAYAASAYRASFDARPLAPRMDSATRAADLEPWNRSFELRSIRLAAEQLFFAEEFDAAHSLMQPIIASREGDAEFIAFYRTVTVRWADRSAAKAHLQHGHERPGGSLTPSDIER